MILSQKKSIYVWRSDMEIPSNMISKEALEQLIEDFILREGTDYGHTEYSLEQKKQHVVKQMNSNLVVITFDPETQSCTLIKKT